MRSVKKVVYFLFSALMVSVIPSTHAMIDLELTQGIAASIPIAIALKNGDSMRVPGNQTVSEVIRNDLQNSGEFHVVNQAQDLGADSNGSDAANWRQMGADYVVNGTVEAQGSNYKIHLQLGSVFGKGSNASSLILDEVLTAPQSSLRSLVHHASDRIYEKLIGVRGIFSTKIAYVVVQSSPRAPSHYLLEVADADGFNPQVLLSSDEPIMSPTWAPDGRHLAYVSFEGHRAAIYEQDLYSGKRLQISAAPGINGAPSFSPDGRYLALVLTKTGNPNIYLLDLQTHQERALTADWYIDTEPAFSADGQKLLFTSNRGGTPQIYEYTLGTGKISRLTYNGNYNARASFIPNSQDIVLMHRAEKMFGIARLSLNSGQLDTLVQTGDDESPSIAPNGKMIIYATQYGGRGVLAQISVDGRIKLRLPAREGSVQEPAWSPFSS